MPDLRMIQKYTRGGSQAGFSLIELLISMGVLLAVSAIVLTFMFDMTMTQATVSNRTDMHSGVRSVTEVL
jgi:prepilin-type N-terminal cleavage/methylation domain-containing protein